MRRTAMSALLSHWRRRPLQLVMLLLGLSLATALWSGVQAINTEARASYDRAAATLGQDRLDRIVSGTGASIAQSEFIALRRAGWLVSPVIEGTLRLGPTRLHLIGIDPLTLPAEGMTGDIGATTDLLAFLTPPGLLYVSAETAERLSGQSLPPLKVSASPLAGVGMTDIGTAQQLLGKPGEISQLIVAPGQRQGLRPVEQIAPGLVVKAPDAQGDLARLTDSFHLNLTAFGFLAFAVGLFIVYSAIGLAFEQRRATFRTLRSLGLPATTLTGLLLAELVGFAIVAGIAGVLLGYLVGSVLLPGVAATLQGLYGASVPGTLTLRPQWWASGLAIALFGTLAAAAQSLWRVWRMPLLAPAQPRAWVRASESGLRLQAAAAIALFAATIALAVFGSGLVAGFSVLGGLLLGAALLLPVLLALFLALMQRLSRRPIAEWFWADTRQQLPGLSLALMALLLALSANIGVGTMVSSFRLTFTGWLDQRLAAELYVTARDEAQAADLRTWLAGRVDAVLPIWSVSGEVRGAPAEIFGVANEPTYRDNWPLLARVPDTWDRVAAGTGALVNEQLSRRDDLVIGDSLVLPGGWTTTVAGIYSDYGNPLPQVMIGIDTLTTHYPDVARLRYGLRLPVDNVGVLSEALRERFDLPPENLVDQASLKRRSLDIFEQTFSVTAALNILTLGVAGLAMFASLMTLSTMRLPQLAPIWAMGLTRRQLVLLELARTLVLAAITLLAALPVGLGLAWVLLSVVNVEAFGWQLPMHIFPADWVRLAALALAASLLSAFIPLRQLAAVSPSDLLKVFANER
ncbi:ABC transporter permease [Rhizobium sp. 9140]|uniref:ABC transporter permease n=1 Tax=Rhizobium sp. 9140 TaxID=1761900 RepID=UPI000B82F0E4|nr:ABC transporter permease [Rhizobium sp. 9140]